MAIEVQQDRFKKSLRLVAVRSLFIKAAIGTDLRTKRNVNIEMMQFGVFLNSVLDLCKFDYNRASCFDLS